MKLEVLNVWGGRITKELLAHISSQSSNVDIFCFQEVFHNGAPHLDRQKISVMDIFDRIKNILPDHMGYFDQGNINEEGLAIFVRSSLNVTKHGDAVVFRKRNSLVGNDATTLPRIIQYIEIETKGKKYTVVNFHGLWNEKKKLDTPTRLEQSKNIRAFMDSCVGEKILCGDFNLKPDTKSLALLEKGMRNLIKEYKITSTRTLIYDKPEKFADYVLVSKGIRVKNFKVLDDTVSDHAPMFLDFS